MELLQELVATVVIALLFSFLVAKLVSLGGDDPTNKSESSKSQNIDQENNKREIDATIMDDLLFHQKQGVESEKRVEFVEDGSQKVDELSGESLGEVIETEGGKVLEESTEEGLTDLEDKKSVIEQAEDNLVKETREIETVGIDECSCQKDVVVVDCEASKETDEDSNAKKEPEMIESDKEDDEDDWEGIERSELEKMFAKAAKFVECEDDKVSDVQMELYALQKVATEGPCREQPPMALNFAARAKWNAWQRLGNMNPEVAMDRYIALVSDKVPGWMEEKSTGTGEPGSSEAENPGALASGFSKSSPHHPYITEERNSEPTIGIERNDMLGGPHMESKAKE